MIGKQGDFWLNRLKLTHLKVMKQVFCLNYNVFNTTLYFSTEKSDDLYNKRLALNRKIMGQQKSDSRKTFKEKFVPPELSMITYFMTKPFVDVNSETEFGYNSDDSMSSEEGGDSDEDIEEDLNRPRTLYVYLNTSKHLF